LREKRNHFGLDPTRRNSKMPSSANPTAMATRSHELQTGAPDTNARAARRMNASPMQMYHHPKSLTKPSSLETRHMMAMLDSGLES